MRSPRAGKTSYYTRRPSLPVPYHGRVKSRGKPWVVEDSPVRGAYVLLAAGCFSANVTQTGVRFSRLLDSHGATTDTAVPLMSGSRTISRPEATRSTRSEGDCQSRTNQSVAEDWDPCRIRKYAGVTKGLQAKIDAKKATNNSAEISLMPGTRESYPMLGNIRGTPDFHWSG